MLHVGEESFQMSTLLERTKSVQELKKRAAGNTSANPAEVAKAKKVLRRLYSWDEIPEWQRDNDFILHGYVKETSSFIETFKSLFYLHNESVNIYSHLIPALGFFTVLLLDKSTIKVFATTTWLDHMVIDLFYSGAFACLILSSSFHCLKSHSLRIATLGNKLDYLGICILIVTSMVSILYYGYFEKFSLFCLFALITVSFGIACSIVSLKDKFRKREWRPYRAGLFVCFGLSSIIPIFSGLYCYSFSEIWTQIQLFWVLLGGVLYIIGAVLYGMRFPEKICPGKFDIWGHSHQLFHFLVVIAALCHLRGLLNSYELVHIRMENGIVS